MKDSIRKWWVLATGTLCLSLTMLDQTIITVALKTIQIDLQASSIQLRWIVNAYLLTFTITVMTLGKVADVIGHKRCFLIGVLLFTLASAACGFSRSAEWLIISRALQGIGSSFMYPPAPAIVNNCFPINERGRATGILAGVAGAFLSTGPFLGGLIVSSLNWPWIFFINIPVGVLTFLIGAWSIPKDSKHEKKPSIDWLGGIVLAVGLLLLIYTLMEGPNLGWLSLKTLTLGTLSLIILLSLFFYEKKHKNPLIHLDFFKIPSFSAGITTLFLAQLVIITSIFAALYFQGSLGFTPIEAGLSLLPITLPLIIFGPINGYMSDHFGPRFTILLAHSLGIISAFWIAVTVFTNNFWWILPGYILMGTYLSGVMSSSTLASINSIPNQQRSSAMGMILASRQLGSTLCVALMGLIIFETQTIYLSKELSTPSKKITHQQAHTLIQENIKKLSESTPLTAREKETQAIQNQGFAIGYALSMFLIGILTLFITRHAFHAFKSYKPLE